MKFFKIVVKELGGNRVINERGKYEVVLRMHDSVSEAQTAMFAAANNIVLAYAKGDKTCVFLWGQQHRMLAQNLLAELRKLHIRWLNISSTGVSGFGAQSRSFSFKWRAEDWEKVLAEIEWHDD